jgi:magnesium chelatase subunit D
VSLRAPSAAPAASAASAAPSWPDEALALLAIDPAGLGGLWLRAAHGPRRDAWLDRISAWSALTSAPVRRLPAAASDDRLLGGLDLQATLVAGRPVAQRALLAEVDGGVLMLPMAERLPPGTVARVASALDTGVVSCQREGLAQTWPARFAVVALDEAREDEPGLAPTLSDRLAFWVLADAPVSTEPGSGDGFAGSDVDWREAMADPATAVATKTVPLAGLSASELAEARARYGRLALTDEWMQALGQAADALGVGSVRALLMAVRVARAAAALHGRDAVEEDDVRAAVRWVLAPRATCLPQAAETDADPAAPPEPPRAEHEPPPPPDDAPEDAAEPPQGPEDSAAPEPTPEDDESVAPTPDERLVAAALAALPRGLLDSLGGREHAARAGRVGTATRARHTGRRLGSRAGEPRGGATLALVDTLRAAAPWQGVRRHLPAVGPAAASGAAAAFTAAPALRVLPSDLRVSRREQRTATATLFVVDASGSSALHRLAEAKGAVNLLLAQCYVRRDEVAVIGFRGTGAQVLLPPTRSLVRARRELAALPGGGGTPLASALEATAAVVAQLRRSGAAPLVVLMTDGRANIDRQGAPGRAQAEADALTAARVLKAQQVRCLLVDTAPRASRQALELARALGARYLELPYAQASTLARAVQQAGAVPEAAGRRVA